MQFQQYDKVNGRWKTMSPVIEFYVRWYLHLIFLSHTSVCHIVTVIGSLKDCNYNHVEPQKLLLSMHARARTHTHTHTHTYTLHTAGCALLYIPKLPRLYLSVTFQVVCHLTCDAASARSKSYWEVLVLAGELERACALWWRWMWAIKISIYVLSQGRPPLLPLFSSLTHTHVHTHARTHVHAHTPSLSLLSLFPSDDSPYELPTGQRERGKPHHCHLAVSWGARDRARVLFVSDDLHECSIFGKAVGVFVSIIMCWAALVIFLRAVWRLESRLPRHTSPRALLKCPWARHWPHADLWGRGGGLALLKLTYYHQSCIRGSFSLLFAAISDGLHIKMNQ